MNSPLVVTDPLAGQEVTIVVTLPADAATRETRPVLVSLGLTGRLPVIRHGALADLPALIHEAWLAFGVQAQLADAAADIPETIVDEAELEAQAPVPEEAPPPARPTARNLSLF